MRRLPLGGHGLSVHNVVSRSCDHTFAFNLPGHMQTHCNVPKSFGKHQTPHLELLDAQQLMTAVIKVGLARLLAMWVQLSEYELLISPHDATAAVYQRLSRSTRRIEAIQGRRAEVYRCRGVDWSLER